MEMTLSVLPPKHTVPAKAPSENGVIPARLTLPNQEIQPFLKNCHGLIPPWNKPHEALPTARETEARGRLRAKPKKLGTESGLSESQSTCFLNVKLNPEAARVMRNAIRLPTASVKHQLPRASLSLRSPPGHGRTARERDCTVTSRRRRPHRRAATSSGDSRRRGRGSGPEFRVRWS